MDLTPEINFSIVRLWWIMNRNNTNDDALFSTAQVNCHLLRRMEFTAGGRAIRGDFRLQCHGCPYLAYGLVLDA